MILPIPHEPKEFHGAATIMFHLFSKYLGMWKYLL